MVKMSEKAFKRLVAEFRRKDRLFPDRGYSFRPWEDPLRKQIVEAVRAGQERGAAWAFKPNAAGWLRPF